jgi:hypothetical protein
MNKPWMICILGLILLISCQPEQVTVREAPDEVMPWGLTEQIPKEPILAANTVEARRGPEPLVSIDTCETDWWEFMGLSPDSSLMALECRHKLLEVEDHPY